MIEYTLPLAQTKATIEMVGGTTEPKGWENYIEGNRHQHRRCHSTSLRRVQPRRFCKL